MKYYFAMKKNEIISFAAMDRTRGYYTKWNKSDRQRQIPHDFTYMCHLKKQNKWTNITKQKESYRYWEQTGDAVAERNRWGRLRGTNFELQNKWVPGMKCTVWGIQSITM